MSRVRQNRMHGSTGGSWRRSDLRQPMPAALGKPSDLSPAPPTGRHLASSLPNQPPENSGRAPGLTIRITPSGE